MKNKRRKSIVWKYTKEELIHIVKESKSMRDLLRKIGLNAQSGSNDQTVKRCLEFHDIDWKELVKKGRHNYYQEFSFNKIPHNELFVENSKHSRSVARNRIISENLIPYTCAICGQEPIWKGKPMTLILDHINGINNDHRLENLRFVCPNCNIQLDTNCGKKRSIKNKVDKPKVSRSKVRPSKEQLTLDILELSILRIGKKYNVSDNAVRKWLIYYQLPVYYKDIKEFRDNHKEP